MTVARTLTNWQQLPASKLKNYPKASPALVAIRTFVLAVFGGANLGLYGVRETRHGGSLSSHAFGAAWDWSYRGAGRAKAVELIEWLIANSAELGVQAIHDYQAGRIWHAGRGWKPQPTDRYGMGQAWGDWLHIEVNAEQWADGRPVADKVAGAVAPDVPVLAPVILLPVAAEETRPTLRRGDIRPEVKLVQLTLRDRCGQDVGPIDESFGMRTETAVRNVQAFTGAPVTGVVDAAFWHLIDVLGQQAAAA